MTKKAKRWADEAEFLRKYIQVAVFQDDPTSLIVVKVKVKGMRVGNRRKRYLVEFRLGREDDATNAMKALLHHSLVETQLRETSHSFLVEFISPELRTASMPQWN